MSNGVYVALLRGINVGGNNIVKMADLRSHLETLGLDDVRTSIQSGNIVFRSSLAAGTDGLVTLLERSLGERFGYDSRVAVIDAERYRAIVEQAPPGFGSDPDRYRCDVLFMVGATEPTEVMSAIQLAPGVDEAHAGPYAVYFQRLTAEATRSRLAKPVGTPVYRRVTIRNWNTTMKLLAMIEDD
jgi:uncharacterized protein (DUF1697 family)